MKHWVLICLILLMATPLQANSAQNELDCRWLLNRVEMPEIAHKPDGTPYFVFTDLESTDRFLRSTHAASKGDPDKRAQLIFPILNGILIGVKNSPGLSHLSKSERAVLAAGISLWYDTVDKFRFNTSFFKETDIDALYDIGIRLAGTYIFQQLDYPIITIDFGSIFYNLHRSPPKQQLDRWLRSYKQAMAIAEATTLDEILRTGSSLLITDEERAEIATHFLKRDAELLAQGEPLDSLKKSYSLHHLFHIHPPAALKYFKRYKQDFLRAENDRVDLISRALVYFKYVLKDATPEIDQLLLQPPKAPPVTKLSHFEKLALDWLTNSGVKFEHNAYDLMGLFEMDFLVTLENGEKVNIEVDGSQHFITDNQGNMAQRLSDVRRDEILKSLGIEVFRLAYFDFEPEYIEETHDALMEYLFDEEARKE